MRSEVVFIGHGSPMNVLADNQWTRNWRLLPKQISKSKGILAISAHWYIDEIAYADRKEYKQIYDMYGFPKEIYDIRYEAKLDVDLAKKVKDIMGDDVSVNNDWGLDHGLWSVLSFMYPQGQIPMVILSIDRNKSMEQHYEIARKLRKLREEGYLILASGNIVHNLRAVDWNNSGLDDRMKNFDDLVLEYVKDRRYEDLVNYKSLEDYSIAIPSPDHYIPFIYALGFLYGDEETIVFNRGGELGTISMTSYIFK